ncbi:MAG: hypothetical protein HYS26_02935 [Candidatus Kaiserbacteria bacterium]|nr:MAG: hypothetical protein HYS26_02935 [Candidatus Kaiserbacteria bacterium]
MDTSRVTPKDFFLWAGAMFALYGSVISLITLLFQYINYLYPDALDYYVDPFSGGIRFAMATLIVLVPVALVLMRLIRNDIVKIPQKAELWVRRWALVLTVFVAGAAVVGDLITLVNYFLGGEITVRFILKVLALLLVAGGVFLHFLADLRGYWVANPGRAKTVGVAAGVAVLLTILAGFLILGTPGEVRLKRLDVQKTEDLSNIQWQIINYWQQKEALPASLVDLEDPLGGQMIPTDPQTGEAYVYRKTADLQFSLCATFNSESTDRGTVRPYDSLEGNWKHGVGEVCFDRTIDPERYPPYPKN